MSPNTFVPYDGDGEVLDADYNSWQEGKGGRERQPTTRSSRRGATIRRIVQVAMVDGSVQSIGRRHRSARLAGDGHAPAVRRQRRCRS